MLVFIVHGTLLFFHAQNTLVAADDQHVFDAFADKDLFQSSNSSGTTLVVAKNKRHRPDREVHNDLKTRCIDLQRDLIVAHQQCRQLTKTEAASTATATATTAAAAASADAAAAALAAAISDATRATEMALADLTAQHAALIGKLRGEYVSKIKDLEQTNEAALSRIVGELADARASEAAASQRASEVEEKSLALEAVGLEVHSLKVSIGMLKANCRRPAAGDSLLVTASDSRSSGGFGRWGSGGTRTQDMRETELWEMVEQGREVAAQQLGELQRLRKLPVASGRLRASGLADVRAGPTLQPLRTRSDKSEAPLLPRTLEFMRRVVDETNCSLAGAATSNALWCKLHLGEVSEDRLISLNSFPTACFPIPRRHRLGKSSGEEPGRHLPLGVWRRWGEGQGDQGAGHAANCDLALGPGDS